MSLAQGRSARQIAPNSKQQALAKLAVLKQGGLKRTEQFEVRRHRASFFRAAWTRPLGRQRAVARLALFAGPS